MSYEIAGELYTSKAALARHYRAVIGKRPPGWLIVEGPDFDFLMGLLRYHDRRAEKIGCGVIAFEVVSVLNGKGIWIVRRDGSNTDVSLLKVIERLDMSPRQIARYDLVRTMRDEIEPQIEDYRRRAVSDLVGDLLPQPRMPADKTDDFANLIQYERDVAAVKPLLLTRWHVDHDDPTFAQLVEGFLVDRGLDYATIDITHGEQGSRCTITDRELADDWRDYHRQHATLRLLTADQNLRRQTPKIDWQRVEGHIQRDSRRGFERMHDE